ncbi:hypothetical protein P3X46_006652 [Hevea brasiliensis]|uniref:Aspartic peptidase DDI1-type domain-containing protein n=1 Tax=Hevea brasiliensis TaxID=3981 RepID=A0ABQ9MQY0_HEVBR|nr:hypothetical protein P3X46_006652 [Hevea brasiliensis]
MLENQIAQQASSLSKAAGKLPSQPEMNLREHFKVVTLRSGRTLVQLEVKLTKETIEKSKGQAKKKEEEAKKDQEEEMPSYVKFLKEILSKKRKLEDYGTVALTKECSAILQNKLPPKLKDLGSFSIPCLIDNKKIDKALCDLGASVSLMPLSICKKLEIGELKPMTISLQLAD